MSDESTQGIAELNRLEWELGAAARTKPVQLVNNEPTGFNHWQVGMIEADPNHTRAEIEHPSPVLDRLRAAIANPNTDPVDREAAREVLRISFHTKD